MSLEKQLKGILKVIKSKRNPISIITQEFSDINLTTEFEHLGFNVIGLTNGITTWRQFVKWFYGTAQNNTLFKNTNRIFIINVDLLSRIPKSENTNKQKEKSYSVYNFIKYCNHALKTPVILITERVSDYRLQVKPLKFGKIIDTTNISYVCEVVTKRGKKDDIKGVLYGYGRNFDPIIHFITEKLLKHNKDKESVIIAIKTYFKLHRRIDYDSLVNYVASVFKLDKSLFMTFPKNYRKYFLLGKNEPSVLKEI